VRHGGAALVTLGILAGCGGDGESDRSAGGALAWSQKPTVVSSTEVTGARVLTGRVRNDSLRAVKLRSRDLRLLDRGGRRVEADFGFVGAYVRPDQPRNRSEEGVPESEQRRVGAVVKLEPGDFAPLSASWIERGPGGPPARLDYGSGSLSVPR